MYNRDPQTSFSAFGSSVELRFAAINLARIAALPTNGALTLTASVFGVATFASLSSSSESESPLFRAWVIGLFFSFFLAFINQLFSIRQPAISIESNVVQLLAFPLGKAWERWMPDYRFRMFGRHHSLNPGPFNKKEHMLIAIMANTAKSLPYTQYIIWTQVLPQYFNQQYARNFGGVGKTVGSWHEIGRASCRERV